MVSFDLRGHGLSGKPGDPKAKDPVDRESSKVQAVACFFLPTDFLNWGQKGNELIDRQLQPPFTAAVDFHEFDKKTRSFVPITDEERILAIGREIECARGRQGQAASKARSKDQRFVFFGGQRRIGRRQAMGLEHRRADRRLSPGTTEGQINCEGKTF